jgi:hypothetical protein
MFKKCLASAVVVSVLSFSSVNAQDCDHASKASTVSYVSAVSMQEADKQPVVAAEGRSCRSPLRNAAKRLRDAQPVRTLVRATVRTTVRVTTMPFRALRVMAQERPVRSQMRSRWSARCSSCEK